MNDQIKILFINGSPRKYGSSTQLMQIAIQGVRDAGGVEEVVYLYDHTIKQCIGCVSEDTKHCKYPCLINDDDFNRIAENIISADGVIIATPVYWYAPSGVLKNFIDRLTCLENMIFHSGRSLLEGKVAGFIVTGLDSGVFMTVSYLMSVLNSMGVIIAPWSMAYTHVDDVLKDENALRDAYNVGYLVVEVIRALRRYGLHIGYRPDIDMNKIREVLIKYREKSMNERDVRIREIMRLQSTNTHKVLF
ncbi:MAG: flavodoxin family protein [Desulfurococcaceae archaeon]